MPIDGAAIWMPTRYPPCGSFVTENASSISVVVASSMLNAWTSASGRSQVDDRRGRRKIGSARKVLKQKSIEMVVARRRDRVAFLEQAQRRELERSGRLFQRFDFHRVAVRLVQQLEQPRPECFGQLEALQLRLVAGLLLGQHALALDARERRFQRVRRRGPIAPLALLVKIHRRAVQAREQRRRFLRIRRVTEVLARQRVVGEFVLRRALPEKVEIDFLRRRAAPRSMKPVNGSSNRNSTLAALTLLRLPCGASTWSEEVVVGEHRADFEGAFFFVPDVHGSVTCGGEGECGVAVLGVRDYIEPAGCEREDLVDAGELQHAVQMLAEIAEAVVAALDDELPGARVTRVRRRDSPALRRRW